MRSESVEGAHVPRVERVDPLRAARLEHGARRQLEALCVDAPDLAAMLGVSLRHLRAMNARGAIPTALAIGRRRVWRIEEIRAWVAAGMPPRHRWTWGEGGQR